MVQAILVHSTEERMAWKWDSNEQQEKQEVKGRVLWLQQEVYHLQHFLGFLFLLMEILCRKKKTCGKGYTVYVYCTNLMQNKKYRKCFIKGICSTLFLMQFSFDFLSKSIFYYIFFQVICSLYNATVIVKQMSSIWMLGKG